MRYTIDLLRDDTTTRIEATPGQTVLGAAEDAAQSLPFGCRTGACGTCTGRVLAGDINHRRPPRALKETHLEEGYALLCIAEPRADCRIAVGRNVVAELVDNPWK
jgi:ferredoxin